MVRSLFGWLLDEGRELPAFAGWTTLLAAAHDAKQARIVYKGVLGDLWSIPRLRDRARGGPRHGQDVRLTDYFGVTVGRLTLDTVTSQPGSARGLSAGAIAWDEMLTQRDFDMWEALAPTQSAQRSPIMILTSTAGHSDSIVLRTFYDRLKRMATGDEKPDPTFYGAWWESQDPDAGLDWGQLKQANPGLPLRPTKQAVISEYGILPPDSWKRERLNHFVDVKADSAFNPGVWAACRVEDPLDGLSGPFALGVDVANDWTRATITAAGIRADGRVGVAVYRDLRGTDTGPVTAARVVQAVESFTEPVAMVVYDSISGIAPSFQRQAAESSLTYSELTRHEFVAACMDVTEMIQAGRLAVSDPLLDAQMPNLSKRMIGSDGQFCFSRGLSLGLVDAIMSMTFAAHAIAYTGPQPKIT